MIGRFLSADSVVPGNPSGGMDGVAITPLTIDFHEGGFLGKLNAESAMGFWFELGRGERQQHGSPMGPANPQSLNRYSYVQNNPLKYTDPTGHAANDRAWDEWKARMDMAVHIWWTTMRETLWMIGKAIIDWAIKLGSVTLDQVTKFLHDLGITDPSILYLVATAFVLAYGSTVATFTIASALIFVASLEIVAAMAARQQYDRITQCYVARNLCNGGEPPGREFLPIGRSWDEAFAKAFAKKPKG